MNIEKNFNLQSYIKDHSISLSSKCSMLEAESEINEIIKNDSYINLDALDIEHLLHASTQVFLGIGECDGTNRLQEAFNKAVDGFHKDNSGSLKAAMMVWFPSESPPTAEEYINLSHEIEFIETDDFVWGASPISSPNNRIKVVVLLSNTKKNESYYL